MSLQGTTGLMGGGLMISWTPLVGGRLVMGRFFSHLPGLIVLSFYLLESRVAFPDTRQDGA